MGSLLARAPAPGPAAAPPAAPPATVTLSGRTFPRCRGCGGFGVGVVGPSGVCAHCASRGGAAGGAPAGGAGAKRSRDDFDRGGDDARGAGAGAGAAAAAPAAPTPAADDENDIAAMLAAAEAAAAEAPSLDAVGVKKLLLGLERRVTKNQLARAKFGDQPSRFLESELELDEELKRLRVLAAAPELYPALAAAGGVPTLLSLLSHDNVDIACGVVGLLAELTDEDAIGARAEAMAPLPQVGGGDDEDDEEDADAVAALAAARRAREVFTAGVALVDALAGAGGLSLLLQHLCRLEEGGGGGGGPASEEDAQGVYGALGLLQNLVEAQP